MNYAACILTFNGNGDILAVSRKDDPEDFGLPGGKIEAGETPLQAAVRELLEETGFKVDPMNVGLIYQREDNDKLTLTYSVNECNLQPSHSVLEAGVVVKWVRPEILIKGTFGDYNMNLFKMVGIKFKPIYNGINKAKGVY